MAPHLHYPAWPLGRLGDPYNFTARRGRWADLTRLNLHRKTGMIAAISNSTSSTTISGYQYFNSNDIITRLRTSQDITISSGILLELRRKFATMKVQESFEIHRKFATRTVQESFQLHRKFAISTVKEIRHQDSSGIVELYTKFVTKTVQESFELHRKFATKQFMNIVQTSRKFTPRTVHALHRKFMAARSLVQCELRRQVVAHKTQEETISETHKCIRAIPGF